MTDHDTPLRVGLIGAGGIAAAHLDAWQALGAQCVLSSRTRPVALAAQFGVEIEDDVDALLDRVDVVGILAPTPTHPDLALRAIARGRHVVCEKPLAVSTTEAQRMADAADAAGVRLFPRTWCATSRRTAGSSSPSPAAGSEHCAPCG